MSIEFHHDSIFVHQATTGIYKSRQRTETYQILNKSISKWDRNQFLAALSPLSASLVFVMSSRLCPSLSLLLFVSLV